MTVQPQRQTGLSRKESINEIEETTKEETEDETIHTDSSDLELSSVD